MNVVEIDEDEAKQIALAEYLECDYIELEQDTSDHYGLAQFGDYAIGTDEEADEAARNYIKNTLWAFDPGFILRQCELPNSMREMFTQWQGTQCECCNDDLEDIIERLCGLDDFADAAIQSDGRGRFLGSYDDCENKVHSDLLDEVYYVYRIG